MGFTSFKSLWSEMSGRGAGSNMVVWGVVSVLSLGGTVGCGVESSPQETWSLETQSRAQQGDNGLSLNGLSLNGLSLNGLGTEDFATWFNLNVEGHEGLMSYMVLCAVPPGELRQFKNPRTGVEYTWMGSLGLAPDWAGGKPSTEQEQQLVSACLAAHVNNYELHVPISVLGHGVTGNPIPYTEEELTTFAQNEACFFGNVFAPNPRLFAGNDRGSLDPVQSTPRPCGLIGHGEQSHPACTQIQRIGQCGDHCVLAPGDKYYAECTYESKTYKMPITTRIRTEDVYFCGDGVCQVGESKGSGYTANSCSLDCGT